MILIIFLASLLLTHTLLAVLECLARSTMTSYHGLQHQEMEIPENKLLEI